MEHAVEGVYRDVRSAAVALGTRGVCAFERVSRSSVSEGRAARAALARMRVRPSLITSLPFFPTPVLSSLSLSRE